MSSQDTF